MNCSACGKPNSDGVSFCEFCGAPLRPGSTPNGEPTAARTAFVQPPPSGRAAQAMARYRDGYLHARTIDGFGGVVKIVALVIGGLLAFGGFVSCSISSNSFGGFGEVAGIMIMLVGLLVGGIGYILGVLVQSAGQSMKAHFDCAVNGSHFLNDDQRAQAMSME
jgi:hypothetical protein